MNKEELTKLIKNGYEQWQKEPYNEVSWELIINDILLELSQNLDETILYLDTCSPKELYFVSQIFEELAEHFKSAKLLHCVERNVSRIINPEQQAQVKKEIEYMKTHI